MPRRSLHTLALLVTVACVLAPPVAQADMRPATVTRIVDGDTIVTSAGRVRLVQIDTPEVHGASECYGRESSAALRRMLPPGTHVRLQTDPALDRRDRYGRLLAYVWRGGSLVNLQLVREGAAAPYFFSGVQGAYARAILSGAVAARKAGKGLWGHCRNGSVALHTNIAIATRSGCRCLQQPAWRASPAAAATPTTRVAACPTCRTTSTASDITFAVTVVGYDPHGFDGNGDGRGCESNG